MPSLLLQSNLCVTLILRKRESLPKLLPVEQTRTWIGFYWAKEKRQRLPRRSVTVQRAWALVGFSPCMDSHDWVAEEVGARSWSAGCDNFTDTTWIYPSVVPVTMVPNHKLLSTTPGRFSIGVIRMRMPHHFFLFKYYVYMQPSGLWQTLLTWLILQPSLLPEIGRRVLIKIPIEWRTLSRESMGQHDR